MGINTDQRDTEVLDGYKTVFTWVNHTDQAKYRAWGIASQEKPDWVNGGCGTDGIKNTWLKWLH